MTASLVVGVLLLAAGMFFNCAAAIGLTRFPDALQRMHASTKAGTLGAGLTIMGAMLIFARPDVTAVGLIAIVFLMLTIPIAAHLLGRAAYVSGAELSGVDKQDELSGVLEREQEPLEQRTRQDSSG